MRCEYEVLLLFLLPLLLILLLLLVVVMEALVVCEKEQCPSSSFFPSFSADWELLAKMRYSMIAMMVMTPKEEWSVKKSSSLEEVA